jgi:hypothetical protein
MSRSAGGTFTVYAKFGAGKAREILRRSDLVPGKAAVDPLASDTAGRLNG